MTWDKYSKIFYEQAVSEGLPLAFVEECLAYAETLYRRQVPVIYDQFHLSLLVGYDLRYLLKASNSNGPYYRTYKIPKRSGGFRTIDEPLPGLKETQRWILDEILSKIDTHDSAKAFAHGCSIVKNAEPHVKSKKIIKLDIENFFGTIKFPRVISIFKKIGYKNSVATLLAKAVTFRGVLPQGAPTSPALSNIVALKLDRRLAGFANKFKLDYTRYADDMTFSGKFSSGVVISFVRKALSTEGFVLNESKTRVMEPHKQQEVTGLVVNEKLQVPRTLRRKLRQAAYFISRYGIDDHMYYVGENRANYINHLQGLAAHVLHANQKDRDALHLKKVLAGPFVK